MDNAPQNNSANTFSNSSTKTLLTKNLRIFLFALIVAIAVLAIGWFIYGEFFIPKIKTYTIDTSSKSGIADFISANSHPVTPQEKNNVLNMITQHSSLKQPTPNSNGEIKNTIPDAKRQAVLNMIRR